MEVIAFVLSTAAHAGKHPRPIEVQGGAGFGSSVTHRSGLCSLGSGMVS